MLFWWPKKSSTPASNLRRYWTLASLVIIAGLLAERIWPQIVTGGAWWTWGIAIVLAVWSVGYFLLVVLTIPFLTSQKFRPDPVRLFSDGLVSLALSIFAFGLIYRLGGLVGVDDEVLGAWDHIYFATVTFSTLGYGDIQPSTDVRLVAAVHAIIGNLHLGIVIGAAFFAATQDS